MCCVTLATVLADHAHQRELSKHQCRILSWKQRQTHRVQGVRTDWLEELPAELLIGMMLPHCGFLRLMVHRSGGDASASIAVSWQVIDSISPIVSNSRLFNYPHTRCPAECSSFRQVVHRPCTQISIRDLKLKACNALGLEADSARIWNFWQMQA